jgi:nucleoside recognition membrane protein YjiH
MKKLIPRIVYFFCILVAATVYGFNGRKTIQSMDYNCSPDTKVETVLAKAQNSSFDFVEFLHMYWPTINIEKELNNVTIVAGLKDMSRHRYKYNNYWGIPSKEIEIEELKNFGPCDIITLSEFDIFVKTYWANNQS